MTQRTTETTDLQSPESRVPVTEGATIAPGPLPWISRMRNSQTAIDPKATLSYIVARADHELPTVAHAPEISRRIRDDFSSETVLQERYRLMQELGRGGMGVVYLGRDQRLDRLVAVKVILARDSGASASATMDSQVRSSFADEARMGASLTHPAIATVFDFGFHRDSPFTIFEFIDGETLRELIERRGKLPLDEVRLIIGPLAQALDFAHARRIVHRDLKPENIRATEQGLFKILDLGLAREFSRQSDWRFAGTPAYAAPEQAAERPPDGRTDQYALAVIVFELLTGRRPFESKSWLDLLEMHFSQPPPRPRTLVPDLSEAVEAVVLKGLEKDPNLRFSTCTELAVALGCQFLTGPAPLPRILLETEIKKMGGRWKTVFYPFSLRRPRTHLALAPDALWAIHRTELMRWPLAVLHDLRRPHFRGLSFRIRGVTGKDRQWLRFKSRNERRRWFEALEPLIGTTKPASESAPEFEKSALALEADSALAQPTEVAADPKVEPVVLLKGRPATRFQLLGMVEAKGPKRRRAENGLAIRAAMMGADAVIDLNAERLPGFIRTDHRASGTAVRAVDDEGRLELKSRWFAGQIARIRVPMLLLAFLFGGFASYIISDVQPDAPVPGTHSLVPEQRGTVLNAALWIVIAGLTFALSVFRWPQLVRPTAICFLAKAVQNGLVALSGLVTVLTLSYSLVKAATQPFEGGVDNPAVIFGIQMSATLLNVLWSLSFLFFYLYLGRRAWRIDQEFRRLATASLRSTTIPWIRRAIGALAWSLAAAFALTVIGWQTAIVSRGVFGLFGGAGTGGDFSIAEPKSSVAAAMNESAWQLATNPETPISMHGTVVGYAKSAVSSEPDNPKFVTTLGVARYQAGDFAAAARDLERSLKLGGFSAPATFALAMANARLGQLEQAKKLYDEADEWMRLNQSTDHELTRFREQAAAVLYMASKDRSRASEAAKAAPR